VPYGEGASYQSYGPYDESQSWGALDLNPRSNVHNRLLTFREDRDQAEDLNDEGKPPDRPGTTVTRRKSQAAGGARVSLGEAG
jgi:hypothetical protein